PRLGIDIHARGMTEPLTVTTPGVPDMTLYDLLRAYADQRRRHAGEGSGLQIEASRLYSTDQALRRLVGMLGRVPGWATLSSFLPPPVSDPLVARSALAAT